MLYYLTTSTVAELLCFLIALACLVTNKSGVWLWMVVYLFITCATEFCGLHIKWLYQRGLHCNLSTVNDGNNWLYNIFLLCEAGFTNLMFANLFGRYIKGR